MNNKHTESQTGCRIVERHVGAFVDGELASDTQIQFEEHVADCASCEEVLNFEVAFREHLSASVAEVEAPAGLRARIGQALDEVAQEQQEEERSEPLLRVIPIRREHLIPLAAAAAVALLVGRGTFAPNPEAQVKGASTAPMFEDVVKLHSASLPSDVQPDEQSKTRNERVTHYFRGKVGFPVRPARFEGARLVGARLSNVRDQKAAALYYEVQGHRMTVVVFDGNHALPLNVRRVKMRGQDVLVQQVRGYSVPVRQHAGLTYAFAGDLDQDALMRLAAQVQ